MDMRLQKKFIPAIFLKSIRRNDIKIPFHLHMNIFHIFFGKIFISYGIFVLVTKYTFDDFINVKFFPIFPLLWSGIIDNDFLFLSPHENIKFFTRKFYFFRYVRPGLCAHIMFSK
jgi:hypothetical protein